MNKYPRDVLMARTHEQIVVFYDRTSNLQGVIAIHNTRRGPALGGTRLKAYATAKEGLLDALRLSEAMTYKAAVAGLPLGGGKAVLLADGTESDPLIRSSRLQAYAQRVDALRGLFITAEDVNIHPTDIVELRHVTPFVVGLPLDQGGSGDPAPVTAFGVLQGMKALSNDVLHRSTLKGVRVAVQGLGKVGMLLARLLVKEGAKVVGADLRTDLVEHARADLGIEPASASSIYDVECDIFAPCAYGGVINDQTLSRLSCKVVAGSANNQLASEKHGELLHKRGIIYAVDYVINAGGLINAAQELAHGGYDQKQAYDRAAGIKQTISKMLHVANDEGISCQKAAHLMAIAALQEADSEASAV